MPLAVEVGLSPVDGEPVLLPQKGRSPPQYSAHVYCVQTAAWTKMPLGTEVGLGLRDIILHGIPAPPPLKGRSPQISTNVSCGQRVGLTKMPLGVEVGLGPGDCVRW